MLNQWVKVRSSRCRSKNSLVAFSTPLQLVPMPLFSKHTLSIPKAYTHSYFLHLGPSRFQKASENIESRRVSLSLADKAGKPGAAGQQPCNLRMHAGTGSLPLRLHACFLTHATTHSTCPVMRFVSIETVWCSRFHLRDALNPSPTTGSTHHFLLEYRSRSNQLAVLIHFDDALSADNLCSVFSCYAGTPILRHYASGN